MPRTKIDRKDWRNIDVNAYNTTTIHTMVAELNSERFGVDTYVPMRTWTFEKGVIKRALDRYGAAAVKETIERAFATYKPSHNYPQLTAGFLITYMLPNIIPSVLAQEKRRDYVSDNNGLTNEEIETF